MAGQTVPIPRRMALTKLLRQSLSNSWRRTCYPGMAACTNVHVAFIRINYLLCTTRQATSIKPFYSFSTSVLAAGIESSDNEEADLALIWSNPLLCWPTSSNLVSCCEMSGEDSRWWCWGDLCWSNILLCWLTSTDFVSCCPSVLRGNESLYCWRCGGGYPYRGCGGGGGGWRPIM